MHERTKDIGRGGDRLSRCQPRSAATAVRFTLISMKPSVINSECLRPQLTSLLDQPSTKSHMSGSVSYCPNQHSEDIERLGVLGGTLCPDMAVIMLVAANL